MMGHLGSLTKEGATELPWPLMGFDSFTGV